ncbi:hypothetical protein RESH_02951 [Rhodopirellula europaea SH398]|uniref:Uncharacterized protein n=1 Tax=Rhodopirellula europaea SH398 TaxID=1263868 RepID=M5S4R6_9BACT|nr:hypothetical protein RESH_02951 [Rhodopirellula europaea SH398]
MGLRLASPEPVRCPNKSHGRFNGFGERNQSPGGRKDRLNPSCGIETPPT